MSCRTLWGLLFTDSLDARATVVGHLSIDIFLFSRVHSPELYISSTKRNYVARLIHDRLAMLCEPLTKYNSRETILQLSHDCPATVVRQW